jgi:para-nitrobenzyl esterase
MNGHVFGPAPAPQTEDCLNLDVHTSSPITSTSTNSTNGLLPVIVWLYGGSLIAGSTGSYPGLEALAALEEVVLVVPNYRLGAFGFLSLPALDATDPRGVSGNYGLLDQQLALKWVQSNVAAFGGDPDRVTVRTPTLFSLLTCVCVCVCDVDCKANPTD